MSKSNSGYFKGTSGQGKALISEAAARGDKINPREVIGITTEGSRNSIVWLEKGYLGSNPSGLTHIMDAHENHFIKKGIQSSVISDFVLTAVSKGKIIGYQGKGTGRPIYQVKYGGKNHTVAVTVGRNGYIVGANPNYLTENMKEIKRIRVMLDYGCYPVWLYDEEGDIIDTLLPEELSSNMDLDAKFDDLQARYGALFINDGKEFSYRGFASNEEKKKFLADWQQAVDELVAAVDGKYPISNEIGLLFKKSES